MVMVQMLAVASAIVSFAATPAAQHLCSAQAVIVPVSTTPIPKDAPRADGHLPDIGPKSRDPAVLLPECKAEPRQKRRKRLSDYPMA
jgi:hypothetical protein